MFLAYHFFQFPALSPATNTIARLSTSNANRIRMYSPALVRVGRNSFMFACADPLYGVNERAPRRRSMISQVLQRRDHMVVCLVVQRVEPVVHQRRVNVPTHPYNTITLT